MTEAEYYTPPQAARILGLSRRRVTQMLNDGDLDGEKLGNGRWKISSSAVDALLKARMKRPASPKSERQVDKAVEETKERAALLERRMERLTDSLSRLFARLELLEEHVRELEKKLPR